MEEVYKKYVKEVVDENGNLTKIEINPTKKFLNENVKCYNLNFTK